MDSPSSGALLRKARQRAGLTQVELARRAGVAQSVISAYESDRRQPALSTLAGLVAATGLELELRVRTPNESTARLDALQGPVGRRARRQRRRLVAAARRHGITNLRVFGSVARGEDRSDSDLDLLADIPSSLGLLGLGRARAELEEIIGARVDLVAANDLKPAVARRVRQEVVAL